MIAVILSLREEEKKGEKDSGWQCGGKKHKYWASEKEEITGNTAGRAESALEKEKITRKNGGVIGVSEHSGYYTACQSPGPLLSPLLSTPCSSSAMISAATRLFLILSLPDYYLSTIYFFPSSFCSAVPRFECRKHNASYMKGRRHQYQTSLAEET